MTNIESFVDQLITEKNLQEPSEVLTQIRADLIEAVEDRINAMILEHSKSMILKRLKICLLLVQQNRLNLL